MKSRIIQKLITIASPTIILLVVLGGCVPAQIPSPAVSDVNMALCSSPGWYGVIPGTTGIGTAIGILGDLSFVDNQSVQRITEEGFGDESAIIWQQYGGISARRNGRMQILDGVVVSIQAPVFAEILLEQAINECGTPSRVRASFDGESPFHWYQLFYPERGLMLVGRLGRDQLDRAVMEPSIRIIETTTFRPMELVIYLEDVENFVSDEAVQTYAEEFVAWPGFGYSIPAYPF